MASVHNAAARTSAAYRRLPIGWRLAGGSAALTGFILLGYAAGSQYQRVAHNATLFGLGLLVLIIIVLVTKKLRDRHRRAATNPS